MHVTCRSLFILLPSNILTVSAQQRRLWRPSLCNFPYPHAMSSLLVPNIFFVLPFSSKHFLQHHSQAPSICVKITKQFQYVRKLPNLDTIKDKVFSAGVPRQQNSIRIYTIFIIIIIIIIIINLRVPIFCDVTLHRWVHGSRRIERTQCFHLQGPKGSWRMPFFRGLLNLQEEGTAFLRNVGHVKRQSFPCASHDGIYRGQKYSSTHS
jgi:hypothetical protein